MKPLLQLFLLLLPLFSHAAPLLTPNMAHDVLQREYVGQKLYWTPLRLPLTVRQDDKGRDGQTLDALFRNQQVVRDSAFTTEDVGNGRRRVVLQWQYQWAADHEGAYYGVRQVAAIDSLSEPVQQGIRWFAQARVRWFVSDLQVWTSDPVLRSARTIRRSVESHSRPFEAALTLEYRDGNWHLWEPEN